jgi:phosphoglycolate phosphatase
VRLRAALFDWDGTLLDSAEASYRCYVRLFEGVGIPFGRAEFLRTYSPDWYRTYALLGLPEQRWAEADAIWLRLYAEERADLIPGARAALDRVRERGLAQGLVTSGSRARVAQDLEWHAVRDYFGALVCGEDAPHRKPHPAPLQMALQRLGVDATEAVYFGDSPEDVQMARAAGVFAVAVPGGFPNRDALAAAGPDLLAEDLGQALAGLLG